jgi:hypothetical protein
VTLNSRRGVIVAVREDGITILLPTGGRITAPFKPGFKVGEQVCYLVDETCRRIIDLIQTTVVNFVSNGGSLPIDEEFQTHEEEVDSYDGYFVRTESGRIIQDDGSS